MTCCRGPTPQTANSKPWPENIAYTLTSIERLHFSDGTLAFDFSGTAGQAYLADVLTKIVNGHPQARIDELLPWAYAGNLKAVA